MKHKWVAVRKTQATFCQPNKRVCERCGATQEQLCDMEWGRIVRRYWEPKVGRCPRVIEDSGVKK
jgi:hypothetical protein